MASNNNARGVHSSTRSRQTVASTGKKYTVPKLPAPDYDGDYVSSVAKHVNDRLPLTNFDAEPFYVNNEGKRYEQTLYCEFTCTDMEPATIRLPLPPTGVSFDYNLRTQTFNTLGGQVIQILGVDIGGIVIQGYFGFEGWFGRDITDRGMAGPSLYQDNQKEYLWKTDVKNGLMQMAHWFRAYFQHITQTGDYDRSPMTFKYPHRGWTWQIRPREFPNIHFATTEVVPRWEVQADFIEYLQDHVIEDSIITKVKSDLNNINNGVGKFTEFIKWSEPQEKRPAEIRKIAKQFGTQFSDYIAGFDQKEWETLTARGFSRPNLASSQALITNLNS